MQKKQNGATINVLHIKKREPDARQAARLLKDNGFRVCLIEVPEDALNNEHRGKAYYFDPRKDSRERASKIAEIIRDIEIITPVYCRPIGADNIECSIWIVKNTNLTTPPVKKTVNSAADKQEHKGNSEKIRAQIAPIFRVEPIILESKRGIGVNETRLCSECSSLESYLWKYSKSNRGIVYICNRCEAKVHRRSFGKSADLMDTPLVYKSGFESKRRRH